MGTCYTFCYLKSRVLASGPSSSIIYGFHGFGYKTVSAGSCSADRGSNLGPSPQMMKINAEALQSGLTKLTNHPKTQTLNFLTVDYGKVGTFLKF
jgi:hypothetical protein